MGKISRWVVKHAATSYIAGSELQDAIIACRQFVPRGIGSTICPWDSKNDTPKQVLTTYKKALSTIADEKLDCYLSIKTPSIEYNFKMLQELTTIARKHNTRIHFDSLAPDTASSSMTLLKRTLPIYDNLGYTLPSRWKRSTNDAKMLIDLGVPVRIVKGQWEDPSGPINDPNSNFLDLVNSFAGQANHIAIATHDTALAKESLSRLKASGTACELEQLYGLPSRVDSVSTPLGIPARIYVPYGHAYLSYALLEIKKRPIILTWLFKDFLLGLKKNTTAQFRTK